MEITQIESSADEITSLLTDYDAADDPRAKTRISDQLIEFLRSDSSIFNRAHEIQDATIEAAITDFVSRAGLFYNDSSRARRAAESTDLVNSLNHARNSLSGESVESARQIQKTFQEFLNTSERA